MQKTFIFLFMLLFIVAACKKQEIGSLKSNEKEILEFEIEGSIDEAEIDNENHTIVIAMPEHGTNITRLAPNTIIVSDKATVTPGLNVKKDFTNPVEYIVMAEDGSTKTYFVTVELISSSAKIITSFAFRAEDNKIITENVTASDIIESSGIIKITVPYLADRENLTPFIRYQGASIYPDQKEVQDFTKEILYTVTAVDGSTKEYTTIVDFDPKDSKRITSFIFEAKNNPLLEDKDIVGEIEGTMISATVSYKMLSSLVPTISYIGVDIDPASDVGQDFSNNVYYTVTAENESTHTYTAALNVDKNTDAGIWKFKLDGVEEEKLEIDHVNGTITGTASYGVNLGNVVPNTIEISEGASIYPSVDEAQNFTSPSRYIVTAQNGKTQQDYWVTIAPNSSKVITKFNFLAGDNLGTEDVEGEIDQDEKMITLTVPFGTNKGNLTPSIEYRGAKIDPDNHRDFKLPVKYTVTANDQTTCTYTVTVNEGENTEKKIKSFNFLDVSNPFPDVFGVVNETDKTVSLTVPYGTDVTALTPTIVISDNASVSPDNGETANFTGNVVYTVTAQNGDTQQYTVTVIEDESTEKEIKSFNFLAENNLFSDVLGTVNETDKTVSLTVPYETNLADLTPTIVISDNATISPRSKVSMDFTDKVVYTVTAENGDTQQYDVTVSKDENTEKQIKSFDFLDVNNPFPDVFGTVNETDKTVSLTVPYDTDMTALAPTIIISGNATISPKNEVIVNFTDEVIYTVTAENGDTQQYTVTVIEDENTEKKIKSFDFLDVNNPFPDVFGTVNETDKTVSLTVPYDTDMTALAPTIIISGNATISPKNEVIVNFTDEVIYTVTAENGDTQQYTVTVIEDENTEKKIKSFDFLNVNNPFPDVFGVVNEAAKTVSLTVPYGTDVTALIPTIVISDNASISPDNGETANFTGNVVYTVTAQNGDTQQYTVTVIEDESTEKEIKSFDFLDANNPFPDVFGVVNETDKTVSLTVPYGTDVTALIPTIVISDNASISPDNGETANFTGNVVYTVTAENGDQQVYSVTVEIELNSEALITDFGINGVKNISIDQDAGTITGDVPYGITLDNISPSLLEISEGATIEPSKDALQDFNQEVRYTVTSEDESTLKEYKVILTKLSPTLKSASYSGEDRVGAGDFEKNNLFEVGNLKNGNWNYVLTVDGVSSPSGTITATNNKASISNHLALNRYPNWKTINIDDGQLTTELKLSRSGVPEKTFTYTNTFKEQYSIRSWQDLQGIKYDLAGDYTLQNDITLPNDAPGGFPEGLYKVGFVPLGSFWTRFTGSFDGGGRKIMNLFIDRSLDYAGLFGYTDGAIIKNVGVEISSKGVTGGEYNTGGLVGYLDGNSTITNCYVTGGSVNGKIYTGGLVGYVRNSTITNCYAGSSVNGVDYTGGLVGGCYKGTTTNCYSYSRVDGVYGVGGLMGLDNLGTIKDNYATGDVVGKSRVGGLLGTISGSRIINNYATGNVTITTGGSYAGGLLGFVNDREVGTITSSSYWDKTSTGQNTSADGKGVGVSSGTNLRLDSGKYYDIGPSPKEEVFDGWNFGGNNDNSPWLWQGNGQWPTLYWQ